MTKSIVPVSKTQKVKFKNSKNSKNSETSVTSEKADNSKKHIWLNIIKFLDVTSFGRMKRTNKFFKSLLENFFPTWLKNTSPHDAEVFIKQLDHSFHTFKKSADLKSQKLLARVNKIDEQLNEYDEVMNLHYRLEEAKRQFSQLKIDYKNKLNIPAYTTLHFIFSVKGLVSLLKSSLFMGIALGPMVPVGMYMGFVGIIINVLWGFSVGLLATASTAAIFFHDREEAQQEKYQEILNTIKTAAKEKTKSYQDNESHFTNTRKTFFTPLQKNKDLANAASEVGSNHAKEKANEAIEKSDKKPTTPRI